VTTYLTGNAPLEDIIKPTALPNLSVIPAGASPPNPGNLLNSDLFKELIQKLSQEYRHVIIDTPPVLGFSDARFVSALADGTLLVTKCLQTDKNAARLATQLLSHSNILGAVLNFVGSYSQGYGNYYYYYQYRYYSKYYAEKLPNTTENT